MSKRKNVAKEMKKLAKLRSDKAEKDQQSYFAHEYRPVVKSGDLTKVIERENAAPSPKVVASIKLDTPAKNVSKKSEPLRLHVPIPENKVGLVIGKGGMTIKSIQQKYKCEIEVPSGPDANDKTIRTLVVITDDRTIGEEARDEIVAVCNGAQSALPAVVPKGHTEAFCTIPNDKVGLVIGKGGSNIKQIMQETGCQVQIPGVPDPGSNPPTRTLSIVGPSFNIQRCIQEIINIVQRQAGGSLQNVMEQPQILQPVPVQSQTASEAMKYTREQWKEWREYYQGQGQDLEEEAPEEFRAPNYYG